MLTYSLSDKLLNFEKRIRILDKKLPIIQYRETLFTDTMDFIRGNVPVKDIFICEVNNETRIIRKKNTIVAELHLNQSPGSSSGDSLLPFYINPLNRHVTESHVCPFSRKDGIPCVCLPIVQNSSEIWFQIHLKDKNVVSHEMYLFLSAITSIVQHDLLLMETALLPLQKTLAFTKEEFESFIHAVSHDLKAPITAILGFISLIQSEPALDISDEIQHYFTRITANATILKRMINDLLYSARLKKRDEKRLFANQLIKEACASLQLEMTKKGITLTIKNNLPDLYGNKDYFLRLFDIIIKNAVQFSPVNSSVMIGYKNGEFFIADTGYGIKQDNLEKVFQIFYTTCEKDSICIGTGLYIARKIAELYNGHMRIESQYGSGSTVYFALPTSPET